MLGSPPPTPLNIWCKFKTYMWRNYIGPHYLLLWILGEKKGFYSSWMHAQPPEICLRIFKNAFSKLSQNFKRIVLFIACRPGFYKASDGNMKCAKCPPHSSTHEDGSVNCRCENNYFRADKDPPSMACTRE